jgi:DNA-binding NarL/FixJ family response regulator
MLIEQDRRIEVIGEAETLLDATHLVRRLRPNIVLFNLASGAERELEEIPGVLTALTEVRVLVLTGTPDTFTDRRAVKLGALGLVSKQAEPELLIKAIQKVYEGEAWLDRCTMANVLTEISRPAKEDPSSTAAQINTLTKRELDIIRGVSRGFKNKQVARHLSISDVTVRHHLTSIFSKLALADRFELIIFAYKHGLADRSETQETSTAGNGSHPTDAVDGSSVLPASRSAIPALVRR